MCSRLTLYGGQLLSMMNNNCRTNQKGPSEPSGYPETSHRLSAGSVAALINTPLQRGDRGSGTMENRFNGFGNEWETVEMVSNSLPALFTPLKRGVNEMLLRRTPISSASDVLTPHPVLTA